MKTEAMVMRDFGRPLEPTEFEIPALESGQVLVKIDAAGVCGSDVHQWRGEDKRVPLPIILGHEGVGTVIDVAGERRTMGGLTIAPGDRIIWNRGMVCGRCWYCTVANEPSLCTNRSVFGINMGCEPAPHLNGNYARHIILRANTDMIKLPHDTDPAAYVSASCSGATIAHAFDVLPNANLIGATVVVQGPGPLGLFAVAFARSLGASHIAVIGGTAGRLELCRAFGADVILDRHALTIEQRRERVLELTCGRGADVVVEAVGSRGVAEEGVRLLRRGGTYLTTGYAQGVGEDSLDFFRDVVLANITIQGVWVSAARHLASAVELINRDPELFGSIVSKRYPLEEATNALKAMEKREVMKAVLEP